VNGRGQRPFGAPFGGFKQSGLGTENDLEELLSYTRVKNVNISSV
jgi:betaine-aldehyde dehydrogenase